MAPFNAHYAILIYYTPHGVEHNVRNILIFRQSKIFGPIDEQLYGDPNSRRCDIDRSCSRWS